MDIGADFSMDSLLSELLQETAATEARALPHADLLEESLPRGAQARGLPQVPKTVEELYLGASHASSQHGVALAPSLKAVLETLSSASRTLKSETAIQRLAKFYFQEVVKRHTTKESLSRHLGVESGKIEPHLTLLASTLLQLDRSQRAELEEVLANSGLECLLYLDIQKYDETPMKVSHLDFMQIGEASATSDKAMQAEKPQGQRSSSSDPDLISMKTSSTVKLFATDNKYAMVFKLPQDVAEASGQGHLVIMGSSLSGVQMVEKTTAQITKEALLSTSGHSVSTQSFPFKARVAVSDAAPSNFQAEELLGQVLGPSWKQLHFPCIVHKAASMHKQTFSLMQDQLTGLLSFSLALSTSSSMMAFRRSLAQVVADRLVIRRGRPSLASENYRHFVLGLFCTTGRQQALKHLLLDELPNGDWQNHEVVECYVPHGVEVDIASVQRNMVKALLLSLTGRVFSTYPQSRWLGADVALDEVGLCQAVHGLAAAAFQRMLADGEPVPKPAVGHPETGGNEAEDPVEDVLSGADLAQGIQFRGGPVLQDLVGQQLVALPAQEGTEHEVADDPDFVSVNNKRKALASKWLGSDPMASLMLMRTVLQPLTTILRTYISRSGDVYDLHMRAEEAKRLGSPNPTKGYRGNAVKDFALQNSEMKFFEQLDNIRTSDSWKYYPTSTHTLLFQALAFRMLSRAGCLAHQLLVSESTRFPLKLFKLLDKDCNPATITSCRPCLYDSFTEDFIKKFGPANLQTEDAQVCLEVLALSASVDTVSIEWSHGRLHRMLHATSQTHKPSLAFLSAQVLALKHKQRRQIAKGLPMTKHRKSHLVGGKSLEQQKRAVPKRKRGGGGAYRAFVSKRLRGTSGKPDFQAVTQAYRASMHSHDESYREAVETGVAATERHRDVGGGAFGKRTRAVRNSMAKLAKAQGLSVGRGAVGELGSLDVQVSGPNQVRASFNMAEQLTQQRSKVLALAKEKGAKQKALFKALDEFHEKKTQDVLDTAFLSCGQLVDFMNDLHAYPHTCFAGLEVVFESLQQATELAEWSVENSRKSNLKRCLEKAWSAQVRCISDLQQGEPGKEERPKKSKCLGLGFCVCSIRGRQVFQARNRLLKLMKASFKRTVAEQKHLMLAGHVCLRLLPQKQNVAEEEPDLLTELLRGAHEQETIVQSDKWWHLGLQYMKPYRPTFQELQHQTNRAGQHLLQQTGTFYTDLEALATLDLSAEWTVEFYVLVETQTPTASLEPNQVWVQSYGEGMEAFWPPPVRRRPTRVRRPRGGPRVHEEAAMPH